MVQPRLSHLLITGLRGIQPPTADTTPKAFSADVGQYKENLQIQGTLTLYLRLYIAIQITRKSDFLVHPRKPNVSQVRPHNTDNPYLPTKSVAVAKKADRTVYDVRYSSACLHCLGGLAHYPTCVSTQVTTVVQTRKSQRIGFSSCLVPKRFILQQKLTRKAS